MAARVSDRSTERKVKIGWREWVELPDWGIRSIKAKIDTGARTSSIHAEKMELYNRDDEQWVKFILYPWQGSYEDPVTVDTRIISIREVKSSTGESEPRPVVSAVINVSGVQLNAEITLTDRENMGFRMLLGREAIRGQFLVNPGISYLGGKPPREIRRQNRGRT